MYMYDMYKTFFFMNFNIRIKNQKLIHTFYHITKNVNILEILIICRYHQISIFPKKKLKLFKIMGVLR